MKKSFLFSKIIAVGVLLLMGVNAKAATVVAVGPSVSYSGYTTKYATIKAAYDAITDATGGYVIELQSDYVPTVETYPIVLGAITNANSSANSIKIQPKAGNTTVFNFSSAPTVTNVTGLTLTTTSTSSTAATLSATTGLAINTTYTIAASNVTAPATFTTGSTLSTSITLSRNAFSVTSNATATITPVTQIFDLSGAKWVTIDGLDATKFIISNTTVATTASQCVRITNDACDNTIKNITANSICYANNIGAISVVAGPTNSTGEDRNTITNCVTNHGASKYTCGIYVSDAKADNSTITYNNITNLNSGGTASNGNGIWISNAGTGTAVTYNRIFWPESTSLTSTSNLFGINTGKDVTIQYNTIGYNNASETGTSDISAGSGITVYGIQISGSLTTACSTNKIANITMRANQDNDTRCTGITLTSTGAGTFSNNTIENIALKQNGSATTKVNTQQFSGIYNLSTSVTAKTFSGNIIRNCNMSTPLDAAKCTGIIAKVTGIEHAAASPGCTYSNNQIYGLSAGYSNSTAANADAGINLWANTGDNILIERNLIYNLETTNNTTTGLIYGIRTSGGNTGTTVQNNMISLGYNKTGSASFTQDATIYGIIQENATATTNPFKYYHNSVYIGGTVTTATMPTYAFYRTGAIVPTTNEVKNNIFANQRTNTAGTVKHYAIAVAATADLSACDYNLYWATTVGLIGATAKPSLATDWKAALTPSNDANSYSSDPKFISATGATADLHLNTGIASDADNNGTFLTGVVTKDYDNDDRQGTNSKSDIGADEYTVTIVLSKPTVTTTTATTITTTTAISGVTVSSNGNAAVSESGVVWSTSANPDADAPGATRSTGGSGNITSLSPNTTYYYRAYATNSQGTGYGAESSFTTKAWTISASVNGTNSNTGSITGSTGDVASNATITLTATATTGRFVSWTEGGAVVSLNRIYTFSATSNRTLVANFGNVETTYYVRPSVGNAWEGIASANQIITTDAANNFNLAYTAANAPDGTATYYFAAGTYTFVGVAATGTQLTSGKIYGGFTGTSTDLNARVTSDLDGNGVVEPWEMTNATVITGKSGFKYDEAGTTDGERLIRIDGDGGEVNGVTLTDFNYGTYAGAISVGTPGTLPSSDAAAKKGYLKRCIVRKIKSAAGVVMMTNSLSVVDQCLIEDNLTTSTVTANVPSGAGAAIYFNRYGGTVSNSVIRNNSATTEGGAIYAGNPVATTPLKAIISNCLIYNNEATTKGGAISSKSISTSYGGVEIVNSTIANNKTGATGNASVEFDGTGLIVNSIVVGDNKADLYGTSASNYVDGVAYGTAAGTITTTSNIATNKTTGLLNFERPTSTPGYLGLTVNQVYTDMRAAKFNITNVNSPAVTTTAGTVTGYSGVNVYSSVPTTDITGFTRTGTTTLGAYQATLDVANGSPVTVSQNATLAGVTVAAGGQLTLSSGNTLSTGSFTLQSSAANGTATFVDGNTTGGLTVTGTTNVQQYLTTGRNWYVSSPVASATSNVFGAATSSSNQLWYYNEPTGTATPWTQITDNVTALAVGKGYIANMPASGVVTFTGGALNTGNITTGQNSVPALTRTAGQTKEGFNLVGNPYPSYLDWMAAVDVNNTGTTNLMTSMWYRTQNPGNPSATPTPIPAYYVFDTYNETSGVGTNNNGAGDVTQFIPPMQAFWVRVKPAGDLSSTTGTLALTNAMRSHEVGTNRLKARSAATTSSRQMLRLQVSNGTNSDEAIVLFNAAASNGFDDFDSPKMTNASNAIPEIYTLAGTEQVVINGLNGVTPNMELPLGFKTGAANSFSITATEISNFDAATTVVLKDKDLKTEQELVPGVSYSFPSDAVNTTSRFSVVFRAAGTVTGLDNTGVGRAIIYRNGNNHIAVNCPGAIAAGGKVEVYNLMGEKLVVKGITSTVTVVDNALIPGVYLVTVHNAGNSTTQKVILN